MRALLTALFVVLCLQPGVGVAGERQDVVLERISHSLEDINESLRSLSGTSRMLERFAPAIMQAILTNDDVRRYLAENAPSVPRVAKEQIAVQLLAGSVVDTAISTIVMMNRLREDSDVFRAMFEGPDKFLHDISSGLAQLNHTLTAVQAMANEMHIMNVQIAPMTATSSKFFKWVP